jgi:hypothetical protein
MGLTYLYDITGSADSKAIFRANAQFSTDASTTKIFELFANQTSIFNVKGDGSVSINGNGGVSLPSNSTVNGLTYYNGSKILSANQLVYKPSTTGGVSVLYFTGSGYLNSLQIEGGYTNQTGVGTAAYREGSIAVSVDNNKIKRGYSAASIGPEYLAMKVITSGSAYLTMNPESYNFTNASRSPKNISGNNQGTFHNILQIQDNSFYFWPTLYSYSTIGRGAGLGIGVLPPNSVSDPSSLKAALHVNVFSASAAAIGAGGWSGTATGVVNRPAAILVTYGSGSTNTPFIPNFFVSSSGNTYTRGWISSSANYYSYGLVGVDGPLYTKGGKITNVNPSSDERLKTDVQPVAYGLNEVSNLNPVTFYWTEEASKHDRNKKYGFIAQHVLPYMPDLVGTDEDGYHNVDVYSMIPILVKAIKELKAEVDDLKSKLP